MQKLVNGELVDMTEEEITEREAEEAAYLAAQPRIDLLGQIAALEAQQTPRRIREAVLGDEGWLTNLNSQIATLRAQL